METQKKDDNGLVFGLDIGTRNVVGTVGYRDENETFNVIAQYSKEHDTRAMLDGQIHDIGKVGKTVRVVKDRLEEMIEQPLTDVCIAAAGRVLKTVTTRVDYEYPEETVVTGEMIHTLELLGVEQAQGILRESNDTKYRFYCVGYSVMKYYINDEIFSNLEGHRAEVISADIIVTFLPEDVVDGLYSAVALADLEVANLTLEPIAAINVAIPEHFRMLNIALVDVGAGTSDICITRDGSIIAYGMIPYAGDEITEVIVQHYLVDFNMAEHIKLSSTVDDEVEFEDIMSITHKVPAEEIWELIAPVVEKITSGVAEKIMELNGDKSVSATFVVGGGGKVHGFVENLAEELKLPQERVALRGEEVLKTINFQQPDIEKDPLIVTPVGICLNYYDQKNSFIMVRFNGERIKLYDNNRLTIVDAALQAGFPNDCLFPRRGHAINFTVDGKQRMIRGEVGESSTIRLNGREVNMNTPLEPNCEIEIIPSTVGGDAAYTIEHLEEYTSSTIVFEVNHRMVTCPRFVLVNGTLQPPTYLIQDGDQITVCNYYTVAQLAEFMDVTIDTERDILVNNRLEDMDAQIYENFSVDWTVLESPEFPEEEPEPIEETAEEPIEKSEEPTEESEKAVEEPEGKPQEPTEESEEAAEESEAKPEEPEKAVEEPEGKPQETNGESAEPSEKAVEEPAEKPVEADKESAEEPAETVEEPAEESEEAAEEPEPVKEPRELSVFVNGELITMQGKPEYVFIDVFDYIDFDLSDSRGRAIVTQVNEKNAFYTQTLNEGDEVIIRWEES
jgi:cell division protein FtsA